MTTEQLFFFLPIRKETRKVEKHTSSERARCRELGREERREREERVSRREEGGRRRVCPVRETG